jgi:sec-independent protein translocase protein TatB
MIDLGIAKIMVVGAVALIVIGPEKLPKVARMAGSLFGRAQRYISEVKAEVSREIELEELRKMKQSMEEAAADVGQTISRNVAETEADLNAGWNDQHDAYPDSLREPATPDSLVVKAKNFRKKKLEHISATPSWYKRQTGRRSRVISGAARVARFRPVGSRKTSSSFY